MFFYYQLPLPKLKGSAFTQEHGCKLKPEKTENTVLNCQLDDKSLFHSLTALEWAELNLQKQEKSLEIIVSLSISFQQHFTLYFTTTANSAGLLFVSRRQGEIYGGGAGVGEGNEHSSSLSSNLPTAWRDKKGRQSFKNHVPENAKQLPWWFLYLT